MASLKFDRARIPELADFKKLALGTHNDTNAIIESGIQIVSPAQAKQFHAAYVKYSTALQGKIEHVLGNGISQNGIDQNIVREIDDTFRDFNSMKRLYSWDPSLAFLDDPIHRKEFDVLPYEIKGKHSPPNPYPGATAAMDGLWPGYDKPEYFAEYPFLQQYEDRNPGKALQEFLIEHNLFFNFPETVSRYGVLFVPPPYLDDDLNIQLRQHLSRCDELYHTAPTVSLNTRVAEARLVLSYVEDDMVAVVKDAGGRCVGVVSWKDLEHRTDDEKIGDICKKDWNEAPAQKMKPEEAFEYMEKRNWQYMLQFTEHGARVVTQTTASISHFLPPHKFKEGLGSALYLGISDIREGDELIRRMKSEADGIPAVIVETAHADTEFYRKILRHYRNRMQDVFMMAGTTISPEAVIDFLCDCGADSVKLGIAEGRACRTSDTGVSLPNAHVGMECGAAAYGIGHLSLDGWGTSGEHIKRLAMTGIQMGQGGGAFAGRRESANPWLRNNGKGRGKFYRGMAGADVQEGVLGRKHASLSKRMEVAAHLHSEGAEVFVPQRTPSTIGRMLLAHMFLLKSAMSYAGVRKETEERMKEKVLHQFHRLAELYIVPSTAA